ncbi:MAG: hypothetical protein OXF21_05715 [bacterium]|nr:hypothetical protein [bacterium]
MDWGNLGAPPKPPHAASYWRRKAAAAVLMAVVSVAVVSVGVVSVGVAGWLLREGWLAALLAASAWFGWVLAWISAARFKVLVSWLAWASTSARLFFQTYLMRCITSVKDGIWGWLVLG